MKSLSLRRRSHLGFTLVELMVVVTIAAILLSIAIPAYTAQVRKSRRTDAKTAVMDLAGREERFFSTNTTYTSDPVNLGYVAGLPTGAAFGQQTVGNGYYQITVAATTTTFTVTATAFSTDQLKDTSCRTFAVDQTGNRTSSDSSAAASTTCW